MPTPQRNEPIEGSRLVHTTCPLEDERSDAWRAAQTDISQSDDESDLVTMTNIVEQQPTPPPVNLSRQDGPAETYDPSQPKTMDIDDSSPAADMLSPISIADKQEERGEREQPALTSNYPVASSSMDYDFSNVRIIPSSPSSFLRAGSKFHGTQQSERQVYDVAVEIKHVDMRESFLCGYLRIQGLTEDHPTLTTYFEGEIIGTKYTFLTHHEDWGSNDKVDLDHWDKFQAFRPLAKQARKGNFYIPNIAQRENIFMRWKEHFLVPDHRVRTISGASFEGFYYICFNQIRGTVSGIYFHAKSEKFQQLELRHVPDRGCFPAMEFR